MKPFFHIFILSYNRCSYISETIDSILAQTFNDFKITVLDNSSTDDTLLVLKNYDIDVVHHKENIGVLNNILKASHYCKSDWLMIFHDDDLLHPEYLMHAHKKIIENPDCSLIGCDYLETKSPNHTQWQTLHNDCFNFINATHFASFCYTKNKIHFASAIYKLNNFSKIPGDFSKYGKLCDRPILIEGMGEGQAYVFKYPYIQYRNHPEQDSQSPTSGPFLDQAISLSRFFKLKMGDCWNTASGKTFILNNRSYLRYLYKWCSDRDSISFFSFVKKAIHLNAGNKLSYCPRPIIRLFRNHYFKRYP